MTLARGAFFAPDFFAVFFAMGSGRVHPAQPGGRGIARAAA
jgi:hypothetical protein